MVVKFARRSGSVFNSLYHDLLQTSKTETCNLYSPQLYSLKQFSNVIPVFKIMTFSGISRNKCGASISVEALGQMLDHCGPDNAHALHQHTRGTK
jgi:hypothetical protein